jgi:ABC-type multidrug transport system ATPase subunit
VTRLTESQWDRVFQLADMLRALAPDKRDEKLALFASTEDPLVLSNVVDELQVPEDRCSKGPPSQAVNPPAIDGFTITKLIGHGGFGHVWQAVNNNGYLCALKVINLAESNGKIELRSLNTMKLIRHLHLLSVHNVHHLGNILVLEMELADSTLRNRLSELQAQGHAAIPPDELIRHMQDAAEGIDYLNESSIQHRDIKPENLLLLADRVKVGDFGLVKPLSGAVASHTGGGTFLYAAPEARVAGDTPGQLTKFSDQYSLAATYVHLRSGHAHYPPAIASIPEAERVIVERALSEQPDRRWPNCREFVAALRSAIESGPPPAITKGRSRRSLDTPVLIEIESLRVTHDAADALVVSSLRLHAGQIVGIVGPAYAGKTTFFRALLGRVKKNTGTVRVCDLDPYDPWERRQLSEQSRWTDGMAVHPQLTVNEFLQSVARMYGIPEDEIEQLVENVIEEFDLSSTIDVMNHTLSAAARSKVLVAATMMVKLSGPGLIILDDPIENLDASTRSGLLQTIQANFLMDSDRDNRLILVGAKRLEDIIPVADSVIVLEKGAIVAHEDTDDIAGANPREFGLGRRPHSGRY